MSTPSGPGLYTVCEGAWSSEGECYIQALVGLVADENVRHRSASVQPGRAGRVRA